MYGLTKNDARVMEFLIRNFKERNSINQIGRKLDISPRGSYKILKKLEKINAIIPEKIGNAIYYEINLDDDVGKKLAELVLVQKELNPYSKVVDEYLNPLKDITLSCILFGSVLKKGREAGDIDVLLILEKTNFKKAYNKLNEIRELNPKKIHDVMMSREDLEKNIRKNDEVVLGIIRNGKVLWGSEIIIEAIKNGTS